MSADPLSVALLTPSFRPEARRIPERIIQGLAVDLTALGHSPRLITSHRGRYRRSVEHGLPVTRHWRPPEPWTLRNIEGNLSHLPFTYASLKAGPPDVAHAFHATDARAARRWSRRGGGPSVFSCVGHPTRESIAATRLRRTILEQAVRESDAVTATSRWARDALWRWFGEEAEVMYPGIDLELFRPGRERTERPTIACVADDHGSDLVVRAFSRVRRARPEARLLLVRPADHARVPRLFREAWVGGVVSRDDAFALPLVESLACGTPVFGSRNGSGPEIVDRPEIGRLFEVDDENEVARAIVEALALAEDPGTVHSCRARAEAFDTASAADAYLAVYRRLLAR